MPSEYDNRLTDLVKRIRPLLVHVALGTCRVVEQVTGWHITAGSTNARYLEHGAAFQIDSAGNTRGTDAVDMQRTRFAVAQVASGLRAFIGSGYGNTASGEDSGVLAGSDNEAVGNYAVVLGGEQNEANHYYSVALGNGGQTHNQFQMVQGQLGGSVGDTQTSQFIMLEDIGHNDSSWVPLFIGGDDGINIPTDTVMTFRALVVGTTSGCTKSFGFEIVGLIENDGGTTSLLGSTVTTIYDADDVSFDCRAQANDTDDTLEIAVSDADAGSDTVQWGARVVTIEITNPA